MHIGVDGAWCGHGAFEPPLQVVWSMGGEEGLEEGRGLLHGRPPGWGGGVRIEAQLTLPIIPVV